MFTDSIDLYQSRLKEVRDEKGPYARDNALIDFEGCIEKCGINYMKELSYYDRKAVHNLKYFTWVEQQAKDSVDLKKMWYPEFWDEKFSSIDKWDKLIKDFNEKAGLLNK